MFGEGAAASAGPAPAEQPASAAPPAAAAPGDVTQQIYDLARQADAHYAAAQAALQKGDWATYGTEMNAVEQLIKQLVTLTGPAPTPQP